jgi:cellulose synthase/poly-beta-1,6-N-acetylglucosamine synthase-like glycosyltransferase
MINDPSRVVYTKVPSSFRAYLDQRIRWLGKTVKKTTLKEFLFGVYISLYIIVGSVLTIYSLIQSDYQSAIIILATRFILDAIILFIYVLPIKKTNYVWMLPFFQLFYPFIYFIVLIGSLVYSPKWKGRKVK